MLVGMGDRNWGVSNAPLGQAPLEGLNLPTTIDITVHDDQIRNPATWAAAARCSSMAAADTLRCRTQSLRHSATVRRSRSSTCSRASRSSRRYAGRTANTLWPVGTGCTSSPPMVERAPALRLARRTDGDWHHVAMTWEQDMVGGFRSYLDGELVAERDSGPNPLPVINGQTYLGAYMGSSEFTKGQLDEVRIWNVVRTQDELKAWKDKKLPGRGSAGFELTAGPSDIYDGENLVNGWANAGGATNFELNDGYVSLTGAANNGWLQHDNNESVWEKGVADGGSWTAEISVRLADDDGNGLVIWGANGAERSILQVNTGNTQAFNGAVLDESDNTDGFHTFRLAFESEAGLYYMWRDGVLLTADGLAKQAGTNANRFIVGDCCSSYLMTTVDLAYIRYDTTGAFSPQAEGLLAYYQFDELGGSVLPDASGNGHHGTLRNMTDANWSPGAASAFTVVGSKGQEVPGTFDIAGATIESIEYLADGSTVQIVAYNVGTSADVTINGVRDTGNNEIAANTSLSIVVDAPADVASSTESVEGPTIVDFGDLSGDASYEFYFKAIKAGASTAIAGNNAFAIKLDQWNEQGVFGTTAFGVADNVFTPVEGKSVASVFDRDVHVVVVNDTAAGETRLYVDGDHVGVLAGNFELAGEGKVMGARINANTDPMGEGSVMHKWATYNFALTDAEIAGLAAAVGGVTPEAPALSIVNNGDGTVTVTFEGTLQAAASVNGPWADVDAPSPLTTPANEAMQYARAVR